MTRLRPNNLLPSTHLQTLCKCTFFTALHTSNMTGQPPPQGYIDPNWPPPGGEGDARIIIYGYTPSFALGVLGCVLFFIAGISHVWQLFRYRTWYFSTMIVGILFVRTPAETVLSLWSSIAVSGCCSTAFCSTQETVVLTLSI
jgi:hypothetical protein